MDPSNRGIMGTVVLDPTRDPQKPIPPPRGYALSGKIMLAAIVVLFTVVLVILSVHLYVRWRVYRRRSRLRRRQRNPLVFASGELATAAAAAHRGLDLHILKSLPVVVFDLDEEEEEDDVAAECAVCLNEFEEGEKIRVLPRCDHRFHIECIDMWFGSHNSCPLCRSPVEIDSNAPPPPAQQCVDQSGESSSDSATNQEVSIEIHGSSSSEESASRAKSRISAIKKFLFGDLRLDRGERDLERGPPPPPPTSSAEPVAA